jgi:hypothetical protein
LVLAKRYLEPITEAAESHGANLRDLEAAIDRSFSRDRATFH